MALAGKHVAITGPTAGIGRVTALRLGQRGARLTLLCRNPEKAASLVAELEAAGTTAAVVPLDLGSLASVRAAAAAVVARGERIDVLINNAGLAGQRGVTADGFELHFGTNHLGHFLLTELLLSQVVDGGKIITVSSKSHYGATALRFEDLRRKTKSFSGYPEYQVSKLCNVLFTAELARKVAARGIHTYAVHPGMVASDIWKRVPWPVRALMKSRMLTNEQGAQTTLHCATSEAAAQETGLYYERSAPRTPSHLAQDARLAAELWQRSVEWTGL